MLIVSEETGPGRSSGRLTYIMKDSPDFEAVKRIMTERYGEGRLEINGDGRAGYDWHTISYFHFSLSTFHFLKKTLESEECL